MALIKADRVKETTTSTGTGNIALAGAATGYRAFSAVCAVGDTLYYAIAHQTAGEWEVGLATYSAANTLTRTTVHASSNSNLAVTFSAGTKDVFLSVTKAWLDTFLTTTSATTNYIAKTTGTGTIGDSQIFDDGTNVGIGAIPVSGYTGYRLQVGSSGDSQTYITIGNSTTGLGPLNGTIVGCDASNAYLLNRENTGLRLGTNNYDRILIGSDGLVSISAAPLVPTPGAQLQVTTAAAATKGLIVKGAAAQSANLQEWQDSSGFAVLRVTKDGAITRPDGSNSYGDLIISTENGSGIIYRADNNGHRFQSWTGSWVDNMAILENGNVGIGATSPVAKLQLGTGTDVLANAGGLTVVGGGLVLDGAGTYADRELYFRYTSTVATISSDQALRFRTSNGAAPAERMRIDASGNVGVGTTSPAERLHLYKSGDAIARIEGTSGSWVSFHKNSVYCGYIGAGSAGSNDLFIYNLASAAVRINNKAIYVTSSDTVGINETSPGAQLQVTTAAAATKGLIVKGASAQSANLLELQNSSGIVLASISSSGNAVLSSTSASDPIIYQLTQTGGNTYGAIGINRNTGDGVATGLASALVIRSGDATGYPIQFATANNVRATIDASGNVGIGTTSPSDKLHVVGAIRSSGYTGGGDGTYLALTGDLPGYPANRYPTLRSDGSIYFAVSGRYAAYLYSVDNSLNICNTSTQWKVGLNPSGTSYFAGGSVAIGDTTATGQLHVAPQAAATKALVVRGASGQSANLQEWQNNSGTALAYVNSSGQFSADGFGGNYLYAPTAYTDYWRVRSFYRAAPTTVGNYIEICSIQEGSGYYEIYAASEYGAGIGTTVKKYSLPAAFGSLGIGTLTPEDMVRQSGYESTFDFELEVHRVSAYDARLRLRRTAGTSARYVTITVQQHYLNATDIVSLTGTGTSTYGGFNQVAYINPWNYSPPVPGGSGSGNGIAFYATSAISSGSGGDITVVPGVSAGGNQISNSDGCFVIGGMATGNLRHWCASRNLPATQGDYVEVCLLGDGNPAWFEVDLMAYQFAGTRCIRRYRFQDLYATSCVIEPYYETTTSSGNPSGIVELEYFYTGNPGQFALRLRRTAATGSAIPCYVNIRYVGSFRQNIVGISGTGTSSIGSSLLGQSVVSPTTIQPRAPVGNSGSGLSLTIQGGNAAGTGNGGSILLQAGAYSTSGSNGKVIVRGLASNTANLQEWQNNAGSLLSAVNSAGDFTNTGGYSYTEKFGNAASVSSSYATAIGYGTTAGQLSTAVGAFAVASGVTSTAFGADANAAGSGGTALGRSANAAAGAVAVGFNASASGSNGIAVGRSAIAGTGTAIGYNFTGSGVGYTSLCASTDGRYATGAIDVFAGDGVNTNANISRQHSILGTWATATYASRLGRVQLRVNDFTTDREAIRYESDGANALTSIGGAAVIASTTLAVQPAVSGNKGIVVKAASGQSANLQEWQNNSGTALALVDASGNVRTTGSIQITSNTPAALTADQNNLVLSASGFQRLSGTAARNITGIAPPSGASHVDGRMMRIYNVGSYNITLKHNSTSSSIANRFCCVQAIDIVLGPRDFAELIYDGTDGGLVSGQNNPCWRVA